MKTICIKTIDRDKIDFILEELEKYPFDFYISVYRFKTYDNLIVHYKDKNTINNFYNMIAKSIKLCVEKYDENKIIEKAVEKNYFYLSTLERKYILEICKRVLELPDEKIGGKNVLLEKLIMSYLKENKKIYLEGFMNFRVKEYKELLDKIVEVSVVSYLDLITF